MNLGKLKDNISFIYKENHWGRIIILSLIIVNGMLGYRLLTYSPPVTYVPYTLQGEATVLKNKADEPTRLAWSLYMAEVLGNVTPETASFVKTTISPLLHASIRTEALQLLDQQVDRIKSSETSYSFEPRDMVTGRDGMIYIVGRHYTHEKVGKPIRTNRTYEFKWDFQNYKPVLRYMQTYVGAPRTEEQE